MFERTRVGLLALARPLGDARPMLVARVVVEDGEALGARPRVLEALDRLRADHALVRLLRQLLDQTLCNRHLLIK